MEQLPVMVVAFLSWKCIRVRNVKIVSSLVYL